MLYACNAGRPSPEIYKLLSAYNYLLSLIIKDGFKRTNPINLEDDSSLHSIAWCYRQNVKMMKTKSHVVFEQQLKKG